MEEGWKSDLIFLSLFRIKLANVRNLVPVGGEKYFRPVYSVKTVTPKIFSFIFFSQSTGTIPPDRETNGSYSAKLANNLNVVTYSPVDPLLQGGRIHSFVKDVSLAGICSQGNHYEPLPFLSLKEKKKA